jgi:O-glycosyl hydrolase
MTQIIEDMPGAVKSAVRKKNRCSSRSFGFMRRMRVRGLALTLLVCISSVAAGSQQISVVLDGASPGRVFDGIGGVSAGASSRLLIDYPEPQRSEILDYLFKPGYGAALQRLKVEIGADVNSTDGSEPSHMRSASDHDPSRGYEWWLMVEAHKRNPNIALEALPWGAPRWVASTSNGKESLYSSRMADYVVEFIRMAKQYYGLDIAYAGIWNERQYDLAYIKELHSRLKASHLSTRIICCDGNPGDGDGQWSIAREILKDSELAAAIDVIGVHYPFWDNGIPTTEAARKTGKPLWSSEDQPNGGGGPFVSRNWPEGGRILAHVYNRNYIEGALTATEIWSPVTSYYDNLAAPNSGLMYANTPWSGHYDIQGTIWATAHTTQFAQPGWRYLDSSSGKFPGKGSYVALRSPNAKDWSVIVETMGAKSAQNVSFRVTGGLTSDQVYVWLTNDSHTFERVAVVKPADGVWDYTFLPNSLYTLTTTTGQGKGTEEPPDAKPFPLPYADNFESTGMGHAAKYLADQDGAFEVRDCVGRQGRCLEQVITEKPVPWSPLPDPFTLAGDAGWIDYRVGVDLRFLSQAAAVVMGRIDSSDVFRDEKAQYPSGYMLRVKPDGGWEILSTEYNKATVSLASGTAAIDRNEWHRVELSFRGKQISASIDGRPLAKIEDSAHTHGMFALGAGWDHLQFDNVSVEQ